MAVQHTTIYMDNETKEMVAKLKEATGCSKSNLVKKAILEIMSNPVLAVSVYGNSALNALSERSA